MKFLVPIIVCLVTVPYATRGQQPRMFDGWGKISLSDEKARLNNLALYLQKNGPSWVTYLMFYNGRRVCAGELQARAVRAKKWLMKRGVAEDRIIWKDAGYREEFEVEIWAWRRDVGEPSVYSTVSPNDVRVINCHEPRRSKRRV